MTDELFYTIAFSLLPGFNNTNRKIILESFGSATAVFEERKKAQHAFPIFDLVHKNILLGPWPLQEAAAEIKFMQQHDILGLSVLHKNYPDRLLHCPDPPTVLYVKGESNFNLPQLISIVGSRQHTIQVNKVIHTLLEGLAHLKIGVISGLALGVDGIAHENALKQKIPTWGVLAHGLQLVYPIQHRRLAIKMLDHGGLITEYTKDIQPLPFCFPKRNRIVAGMSDATIIVETDIKGGSMITANLAAGYNREIFAVPGKIHDTKSAGCLLLIKEQKATMYYDPIDFLEKMNWPAKNEIITEQVQLALVLDPTEQALLSLIELKGPIHKDQICTELGMQNSQLATHLLHLELSGYIHLQVGNTYSRL